MERKELSTMLLEMLEYETGEKYPDFDESADLRHGLALDSVDMVSLILRIENKLKIDINSSQLEHVVKVADLLDLLQAKLAERESRAAA